MEKIFLRVSKHKTYEYKGRLLKNGKYYDVWQKLNTQKVIYVPISEEEAEEVNRPVFPPLQHLF